MTGGNWKQREGSLSIALNRAPSFLLLEAGCGTLAANQVAVAVIGPVPYATLDAGGSIAHPGACAGGGGVGEGVNGPLRCTVMVEAQVMVEVRSWPGVVCLGMSCGHPVCLSVIPQLNPTIWILRGAPTSFLRPPSGPCRCRIALWPWAGWVRPGPHPNGSRHAAR